MNEPTVLLDTNVLIMLRRQRPPVVRDRFVAHGADRVCTSTVVIGELRFGADKAADPASAHAALDALAAAIDVIPVDERVASHYGRIRADLERRGALIGGNDLWIAAHALALGLTLVTANIREFERVPGLAVEDWTR